MQQGKTCFKQLLLKKGCNMLNISNLYKPAKMIFRYATPYSEIVNRIQRGHRTSCIQSSNTPIKLIFLLE
jgi:hypothetical protein